MPGLRELQECFYRAIAGAPGPAAAASFDHALLATIAPRAPLGAAERLDVYAQMYWARLHDVLADDFPRLAAVLGPERFADLACRYLAHSPSQHPSVRHVGRRFADFVAGDAATQDAAWAGDLARLEWARLAVFDAADTAPLRVDDLRGVPAGAWPDLHFTFVPALRVLRVAWPVHELWRALAAGEPASAAVRAMGPADTLLRVWRKESLVYQASVDAAEALAIACVERGERFAGMCEALAVVIAPDEAAGVAAALVLRWVEDGILQAG